jgi:hypothetical protein
VDWSTLVPLLIGGGLTLGGSERAARHQTRRERAQWAAQRRAASEDRRTERTAVKEDRRAAFELENLLALQDALAIEATASGSLFARYIDHVHAGGSPNTSPLELLVQTEGDSSVRPELVKLTARILDADVLRRVKAFRKAAVRAQVSQSMDEAEQDLEALREAYDAVNDAIAVALQRLHEVDLGGEHAA